MAFHMNMNMQGSVKCKKAGMINKSRIWDAHACMGILAAKLFETGYTLGTTTDLQYEWT